MISAYGGKCAICGEARPEFLTLDHIKGGGWKERGLLGGNVALLYKLRDSDWPKRKYRLLCWNCNCRVLKEGSNAVT